MILYTPPASKVLSPFSRIKFSIKKNGASVSLARREISYNQTLLVHHCWTHKTHKEVESRRKNCQLRALIFCLMFSFLSFPFFGVSSSLLRVCATLPWFFRFTLALSLPVASVNHCPHHSISPYCLKSSEWSSRMVETSSTGFNFKGVKEPLELAELCAHNKFHLNAFIILPLSGMKSFSFSYSSFIASSSFSETFFVIVMQFILMIVAGAFLSF